MGHVVCSVLDKCRRCYHCVRECPVNAIRVEDGQARVVEERCICCGTCIRVCNQGAKTHVNAVPEAWRALEMGRPAVAVLAPSFVASFTDVESAQVVGALKELGFTRVVETAYGAEWTARAYQEFLDGAPHEDGTHRRWADMKPPFLATTCPAVVKLVEIHRPQLIPHLVPIVSPMVATARYLRRRAADEGAPDPIVVFIGPCVAKKEKSTPRASLEMWTWSSPSQRSVRCVTSGRSTWKKAILPGLILRIRESHGSFHLRVGY